MNLSRVTASIALVAYLLGGWLLPAVHDHAAHGEHQTCGHTHAAGTAEAAHQHPHHDAAHACCHDAAPDTAPAGDLTGHNASLAQNTPAVSCDGLCVLCQISTRKFTAACGFDTGYVRAAPVHRTFVADQPRSRSVRLSIDGPRGPPARLG